jgi:CheY-like chemotaxis protein
VSSNSVPHVFVVDDEQLIASSLAATPELHGYSATFFNSPQEALAAARSKAPDLLISDVQMPSISGIDLAIQMRAQYPTCKILLFSGQPATFDLLLKPMLPTGLLFEVRRVINGAQCRRRWAPKHREQSLPSISDIETGL